MPRLHQEPVYIAKEIVMKLQPLFDNVLVRLEKPATKTESGITIPESIQRATPQRATVIAVGPGKCNDGVFVEPRVKPGDRVILGQHTMWLKLDDDHAILPEDNFVAIERD